jgi:hypothetical protein
MRYRTPSDVPTDDMSRARWKAECWDFFTNLGVGCAGKRPLMDSHRSVPFLAAEHTAKALAHILLPPGAPCRNVYGMRIFRRRMVREQRKQTSTWVGVAFATLYVLEHSVEIGEVNQLVLPADTHMKVNHTLVSEHDWLFRIYLHSANMHERH